MKEFDKIYLSWRKGQGKGRHVVGVLEKSVDDKFSFKYIHENIEDAIRDGFSPYTEFPDIDKVYEGNVLDIFSQRLTKSERPDIQSFYDFWEIEPQHVNDKFYLLGHTQGLLPTDNFEFLADYNVVPGLHFLTDLASLSVIQLPSSSVSVGDTLTVKADKDNQYDDFAIAVFKDDMPVGHIKRIHCKVFHKPGAENLKLRVKALDKNGIIKRIFVKVYMD